MARTLAAVAREAHGRLVGADSSFGLVSTDTRSLVPGALFVAIPGDRFDGNDFVPEFPSLIWPPETLTTGSSSVMTPTA